MGASPGRREKPAVSSSLPFQSYNRVLRSFSRKRDRKEKNGRAENDQELLTFLRYGRFLTLVLLPVLPLVSSHLFFSSFVSVYFFPDARSR